MLATFAASITVLTCGAAVLLAATAGGNAFTTETLRRHEVSKRPLQVPELAVHDATGRVATLNALLAGGQRAWIVDFVYTRCQSVCLSLGTVFQQLQEEILARGLEGQVGLLSVSFDPENDSPDQLRAYAQRMRMNPHVWQAVSLAHPQDRRALLDAFGIMVIPAPLGEFEHNAALHVVDSTGRLVLIVDADKGSAALAAAKEQLP